MQVSTSQFASIVAGNDLLVHNVVTWVLPEAPQYDDLSYAVDSISIARSMTTDAPAEARMITGYPSSNATITVSGLLDKSDADTDMFWLANPYEPSSPVYRENLLGTQISVQSGLWTGATSPEMLTQFTGLIDSYVIDPLNGTVTLSCLDFRNRLRTLPPSIPAVSNPMRVARSIGGFNDSVPVSPGLTNLFVIDSLLRANSIYANPDRRADCVLYMSMIGSAFPQVYNLGAQTPIVHTSSGPENNEPNNERMQFVGGNFTSQVPRDHSIVAGVAPWGTGSAPILLDGLGSGGYFLEGWYNFATMLPWSEQFDQQPTGYIDCMISTENQFPIVTDAATWLDWNLSAATLQLGALGDIQGPPIDSSSYLFKTPATDSFVNFPLPLTIAPGWHQFGVQIQIVDTTHVRTIVYVDRVAVLDVTELLSSTGGNASLAPLPSTATVAQYAFLNSTLPAESVQLTSETAATPLNGFTPTATLDASLNPLTVTLDVTGDPWAALQALAQSEFGFAGFDELGQFFFLNRHTLRNRPVSRTISSRSSLKAIQAQMQSASALNSVSVPINGIAISPFEAVYTGPQSQTAFSVGARSTYSTIVNTSTPTVALSPIVSAGLYPQAGPSNSYPLSGWRASTTADGTGSAVTTGVTMSAYQLGATALVFTIKNTNQFPVYFVTPAGHGYTDSTGTPYFILSGCAVTLNASESGIDIPIVAASTSGTAPTQTGLPNAVAAWDAPGSALTIAANAWLQLPDVGQTLADELLDDNLYPRPQLTGMSIVADPRLQLSDRVTIYDPDASKMNDDVIIFGISTTISATDWSQSVDARALSQPGFWTLGVAGRSEMGVTTYS